MGRKTKIDAPPGYRGCPKCSRTIKLIDYGKAAYCRECWAKYCRERKSVRQLIKDGAVSVEAEYAVKADPEIAKRPTMAAQIQYVVEEQQLAQALRKVPDMPLIGVRKKIECACCINSKVTSTINGKTFCERCSYYISQCGRCAAHALRRFVPELLHRPIPPLLPGDLGYGTKEMAPIVGPLVSDPPAEDELGGWIPRDDQREENDNAVEAE